MKTKISLILILCVCALYLTFTIHDNSSTTDTSSNFDLIIDKASLLDEEQIAGLNEYHNWVLDNHDIDIRVITLKEKVDLNMYAADTFENEQVGSLSSANRGLLFLLDTVDQQVRIEVSTNLESVFTDAFIGYIEDKQMVPFFERHRLADGIFATTELIRIRAQDAAENKEFQITDLTGSIGGIVDPRNETVC